MKPVRYTLNQTVVLEGAYMSGHAHRHVPHPSIAPDHPERRFVYALRAAAHCQISYCSTSHNERLLLVTSFKI